jgi:hypothetical protein
VVLTLKLRGDVDQLNTPRFGVIEIALSGNSNEIRGVKVKSRIIGYIWRKKGAIQMSKTLPFKVWTKIRSAGARDVSEVLLLPKFSVTWSAINEKEEEKNIFHVLPH